MKTYVLCVLSVDGFHQWRDAFEEVSYLRSKHRHVFEIEVQFGVSDANDNREVEIIDTQNKIKRYLLAKYGVLTDTGITTECDFGNMSCESIAKDILTTFEAKEVKVTEDGFGGAIVKMED